MLTIASPLARPFGRLGRTPLGGSVPSLMGLGAYEQGQCSSGADFVCSEKGGEYSCRPCDYAQLDVFRELQEQINRLIVTYNLGNSLDVDGRIGDDTTAAAARIHGAIKSGAVAAPPAVAQALAAVARAPRSQDAMHALAAVADETVPYFATVADAAGAPDRVPEGPPIPPVPPGPSEGGPFPQVPPRDVDQPPVDPVITQPVATDGRKRARRGYVIGGVALLAAVGLIGAAAYYKSDRGS
jgi:hypothetical protein